MGGFHIFRYNAGLFEPYKFIEVLDLALYFVQSFFRKLRLTIKVVDILFGLIQLFFILFIELLQQIEFVHKCLIIGPCPFLDYLAFWINCA